MIKDSVVNEICGIYKIVCTPTGQCYIGYSRDINNRYYSHKRSLIGRRHSNSKLQFLWDRFGEEAFDLEVIEMCPIEKLKEREDYYFNRLKPDLNIAPTSNGPSKNYLRRMQTRKERIKNLKL